jgi:hypothetical protein
MVDFDVVIGGGSPIMALIALKCAIDLNLKVVIVDAAPTLGGSWTPQRRFGYKIDNGPHLLYNFNSDIRPILSEISRLAEVRFRPMQPQPHSDHWLHRSIMEYSFGLTAASRPQKLARAALAVGRKIIPWAKAPQYFEPEGGLSTLASMSDEALQKHGVDVRRATPVSQLVSGQDYVRVETPSGSLLASAFIGSARLLPQLEREAGLSTISQNVLHYAQAYILLDGKRQKFSYYRPFKDPLIFLAADLTGSASPPAPPDCRILSVNLKAGIDYATVDNERIRQFLLKNALIDEGDRIEAVEWESIKNPEIHLDWVQARNGQNKNIHYVHCNNKVKALSEYMLGDRLEQIVRLSKI